MTIPGVLSLELFDNCFISSNFYLPLFWVFCDASDIEIFDKTMLYSINCFIDLCGAPTFERFKNILSEAMFHFLQRAPQQLHPMFLICRALNIKLFDQIVLLLSRFSAVTVISNFLTEFVFL